jgi:hypothetical protein
MVEKTWNLTRDTPSSSAMSSRLSASLRLAWLTVQMRLPGSGDELEMDLLKEALGPGGITVQLAGGASVPAVSLDGAVGLKARAWHDRFVIRDIIDLHAAADAFSYVDIENLARRHEPALDLGTILDHLAGISVFPDEDFAEYGLDVPAIVSLRAWATGWYDDLARRLASEHMDDETLDGP